MSRYLGVIVVGLLGTTGPVWALSCADLGGIARTAQKVHVGGATDFERTALAQRPVTLVLSDGQWAALRAASRLGFYSTDHPESVAAAVEALCHGGFSGR